MPLIKKNNLKTFLESEKEQVANEPFSMEEEFEDVEDAREYNEKRNIIRGINFSGKKTKILDKISKEYTPDFVGLNKK